MPNSRFYVYTIWPNFGGEAYAKAYVQSVATRLGGAVEEKKVTFYGLQLETAPDTHRIHLQTYVEFPVVCNGKAINKVLGITNKDYHGEERRGTAQQAFAYTQKDDSSFGPGFRFSGGTISTPEIGKRNDLIALYEFIKAEGPRGIKRCLDEHPASFMRYARGVQYALSILDEPGSVYVQRDVRVIVGNTGSGKSKLAYHQAFLRSPGSVCILPAPSEASWLDGYRGHDSVILDDYAPSSRYPHAVLLRMLDGFEYPAPVKGGFVVFRPHSIFITTNYHPYEWYPAGDYPALRRRITSCQLLGEGRNFDGVAPRDFWGTALALSPAEVVPVQGGAPPVVLHGPEMSVPQV